jgi:FKBP-type peptidyl-prolyl cis-trans isomerase
VVDDTIKRGKPIVFPFKSRPFTGGLNPGLVEVVSGMKAGGRRSTTVPPTMGFGDEAYALKATLHASEKGHVVPPNSPIEYDVTLVRVSIAPS